MVNYLQKNSLKYLECLQVSYALTYTQNGSNATGNVTDINTVSSVHQITAVVHNSIPKQQMHNYARIYLFQWQTEQTNRDRQRVIQLNVEFTYCSHSVRQFKQEAKGIW